MSFSPSPSDLERVNHTHHPNSNQSYNRQQTYHHHHYHHLDRVGTIKRGIEKMTEEIVYRPNPHPAPYIHPSRRMGSGDDGYIRPEFRKGPYDTDSRGSGGNRLNPKARSFFTTYPMCDALPTIDPPLEFRPPPPTRPIQIRPDLSPPPGPVPTQVRRGYDRPHHPHHNDNTLNSTSKALIIRDPSSQVQISPGGGFEQGQVQGQPLFRPSPNHHTQSPSPSPSTTFHIGPVPPIFTIEQIHTAMKSLNPKIALFDIKLGTIEIEIPFTLTWQQIGDWCRRGIKIGELTIPVRSGVSTNQQRPWS